MKKMELDAQTRASISEVSTVMGVSEKLVISVMENMLIAWGLKYLKDMDNGIISLPIPYIGSLGIKALPEGSDSSNMDFFLAVSDDFKKFIADLNDGKDEFLGSFIQNKICKDLDMG